MMISEVVNNNMFQICTREQWVKLGGLSTQDMEAINNLAYLGVQFMKQTGKVTFKWLYLLTLSVAHQVMYMIYAYCS